MFKRWCTARYFSDEQPSRRVSRQVERPVESTSGKAATPTSLQETLRAVLKREVRFTVEHGDVLSTRTKKELRVQFPKLAREEVEKVTLGLMGNLYALKGELFKGFDANRIEPGDEVVYRFTESGGADFEYVAKKTGERGSTNLRLEARDSLRVREAAADRLTELRRGITLEVTEKEKTHATEIVRKVNRYLAITEKINPLAGQSLSVAQLRRLLTQEEMAFVLKISAIDPKTLGLPMERVPIQPLDHPVTLDGVDEISLTEGTRAAFLEMAAACQAETGEDLLLTGGHRSEAAQAVRFMEALEAHQFDLSATLLKEDLPGYSPHLSVDQPAIEMGVARQSLEQFEHSAAHAWLTSNAPRFGFEKIRPRQWKFLGKPVPVLEPEVPLGEPQGKMVLPENEQRVVQSLHRKVWDHLVRLEAQNPTAARLISVDEVKGLLSPDEREWVERFLQTDPSSLDILTPKVEGPPLEVARVAALPGFEKIPMTPEAKEAFVRMSADCQVATTETLYPTSGYRSEGYQLALFIDSLTLTHGYNMKATAQRVAFPGYSEHQSSSHVALDVAVPGRVQDEFKNSGAYAWMQANAAQYGFVLSYPEGNAEGIAFEPWHWHYEGVAESTGSREEVDTTKEVAFVQRVLLRDSVFNREVLDGVSASQREAVAARYAEDFIQSMQLSGIPLHPNNIRYLLTVSKMESAFGRTTRSGREILEQAQSKYGFSLRAVEVAMSLNSKLSGKYEWYKRSLTECTNEQELYEWGQALATDLEGELGDQVRSSATIGGIQKMLEIYNGESSEDPVKAAIETLRHKPSTIGKYQVNVDILIKNASQDLPAISRHPVWGRLVKGDTIDRDLLVRSLFDHDDSDAHLLPQYAAEGFVMGYYMAPILRNNDLNNNGSVDENEVGYSAADFHAGSYASRNAAVQAALNQEMGAQLVVDGDLSLYDVNGDPRTDKPSATMSTLFQFAERLPVSQRGGMSSEEAVRSFVLAGKKDTLENHPLWQALVAAKGRPSRVLPKGATTEGVDTELNDFAVTNAENYAVRFKGNFDRFA